MGPDVQDSFVVRGETRDSIGWTARLGFAHVDATIVVSLRRKIADTLRAVRSVYIDTTIVASLQGILFADGITSTIRITGGWENRKAALVIARAVGKFGSDEKS